MAPAHKPQDGSGAGERCTHACQDRGARGPRCRCGAPAGRGGRADDRQDGGERRGSARRALRTRAQAGAPRPDGYVQPHAPCPPKEGAPCGDVPQVCRGRRAAVPPPGPPRCGALHKPAHHSRLPPCQGHRLLHLHGQRGRGHHGPRHGGGGQLHSQHRARARHWQVRPVAPGARGPGQPHRSGLCGQAHCHLLPQPHSQVLRAP
mmetsp:Transcript_29695/g.79749  ORF Transcript_29695/g.79749 Transcript_29695/m.79749 type:complete len:205 (-) Transcript_29695:700-1314(-)